MMTQKPVDSKCIRIPEFIIVFYEEVKQAGAIRVTLHHCTPESPKGTYISRYKDKIPIK